MRKAVLSYHPPQLRSNPVLRHTFRYAASASFSEPITNNNVLGALGGIGTVVNSTITNFFGSFRINRIRIWGASTGALVSSVSVTFFSAVGNAATNMEFSDSSTSSAEPPYLQCAPPKGSQASFWNSSSASTLFTVVSSTPCIVDLDVSAVFADGAGGNTTGGLGTVAVGNQYWLALDGASTNKLIPVSLNTTT